MRFTQGSIAGSCARSRLHCARGRCSEYIQQPQLLGEEACGLRVCRQVLQSLSQVPGSLRRSQQGHAVTANSKRHRCFSTESGHDSSRPPINKEYGGTVMTGQLYDYLLNHTREPETTGACKALELGVFTGYSALAVALALPEHGKLVACDRDPRALHLAQHAFAKAGIAHKVEIRQGMALDVLQSLLQQSKAAGSFDFAFIDADKRAYSEYFELCLKLLRSGGILALDNVLWYGRVADPAEQDKRTVALRKLNAELLNDQRIIFSIVPIGDGMALCTKL